jgi:N-acetyl-anhydromuramyl-L-alanine amidase AmpD
MQEARYHVNSRGYRCLGYHYMIDPRGGVYKCSGTTDVTAHAAGANDHAVGIALMGNFMSAPPPAVQLQALAELIAELRQAIPTIREVLPHRRVKGSSTACPGAMLTDDVIALLAAGKPA